MTITREEWQNDLRKRIGLSLPELKRVGVYSGYAIIAASVILPVAIAGGGWFPALVAMVGSVGASLISNMAQGIKDEVDLARKIESLPASDPTHQHIHLLLEKLDAINVARQGLPESDWMRLEQLLDRKLSNLTATQKNPSVSAPIIVEKINGPQARQIARQYLKQTWWINKQQGKSTLQLFHWPMAYYSAQCVAKYQLKTDERYKDEKSDLILVKTITSEHHTNPLPIQMVFIPKGILQDKDHVLTQRVYNSINGFDSANDINWGNNGFIQWGYEKIILPSWNFLRYRFRSGAVTAAGRKIKFWNFAKSDYKTKPNTLEVPEQKVLEDARYLAKQELVRHYNATSNMSLLETHYGQEEINFAHYPFWVFENNLPDQRKIVVDGLNGKVLYTFSTAGLAASITVSTIMFLVILFVIGIIAIFISLLLLSFR